MTVSSTLAPKFKGDGDMLQGDFVILIQEVLAAGVIWALAGWAGNTVTK